METIKVRGWEYQVEYDCEDQDCYVIEVYPSGSDIDIDDLITSDNIRREFDNALQAVLIENDVRDREESVAQDYLDKKATLEHNPNEGIYQ